MVDSEFFHDLVPISDREKQILREATISALPAVSDLCIRPEGGEKDLKGWSTGSQRVLFSPSGNGIAMKPLSLKTLVKVTFSKTATKDVPADKDVSTGPVQDPSPPSMDPNF